MHKLREYFSLNILEVMRYFRDGILAFKNYIVQASGKCFQICLKGYAENPGAF